MPSKPCVGGPVSKRIKGKCILRTMSSLCHSYLHRKEDGVGGNEGGKDKPPEVAAFFSE